VTFWFSRVSKSFPGERINWIELQNPHASIHLIRNVYISSGSCQFTPPQSIHFQVQYPYKEYISRIWHSLHAGFWGVNPPNPHTALAKSEGLTPPGPQDLKTCRIHPPCSLTSWGGG
jgi:hypothetical protein